jgi:putative addiction module killer protein
VYEIRHYQTLNGRIAYLEWHRKLRDVRAKLAIDARIRRMELGNFGDHKPCREGVWELRVDVGVGYRVYYAISRSTVIVLLCGGDKDSQTADINRACGYWRRYQGEEDAKRKS